MKKEETAAILTIKDAPRMTKAGKKYIADWLRRQAITLMKHGNLYSKRYTARYMYFPRK